MNSNQIFMRRENFLLTGLLVFLVVFLSGCQINKSEKDKPNILFIGIDDLRPNLACYGDTIAISPNIDKLANAGTLFTRAYCQQASCAPSRTSLLTGRRPDEIGVVDHATHFRDNFPETVTLPQLFKLNGYKTISIGKIFHFAKGFQDSISWSEPERYKTGIKKEQYVLPKNRTGGKAAATECVNGDDNLYWDGHIAGEAVQYLQQFESKKTPFFLAVGFLKPHLPFCAPKKYWDLYANEFILNEKERKRPENAPNLAFHQWQELRGYKDIPKTGPLPLEQEKTLRHGYYACISYVDAQIGKILNELERLGLAENTIIVLWGDHGYHLGEQDLWHKHTNFELDARVPLILKVPGGKMNSKKTEIVELLDIYPTLADICGLRPTTELSGRSLLPLIKDSATAQKSNFAFNQYSRPYGAFGKRGVYDYMGYAVRSDKYRYVAWFKKGSDTPEIEELYDLSKDGIETENIIGDKNSKDVEQELKNRVVNYKTGNYEEAYN